MNLLMDLTGNILIQTHIYLYVGRQEYMSLHILLCMNVHVYISRSGNMEIQKFRNYKITCICMQASIENAVCIYICMRVDNICRVQ